ncbi:hypothetical protein DFH07DRAFT_765927 [Mycena maculata]|uniref:Uncharacterized protein n=1 Tax=Mycena maculata TaxID=230809 RepID=A0AAD7KA36_9AGAR|nr:hypothetical protein DFH07DRAFT_765927 [Mycena maculata]
MRPRSQQLVGLEVAALSSAHLSPRQPRPCCGAASMHAAAVEEHNTTLREHAPEWARRPARNRSAHRRCPELGLRGAHLMDADGRGREECQGGRGVQRGGGDVTTCSALNTCGLKVVPGVDVVEGTGVAAGSAKAAGVCARGGMLKRARGRQRGGGGWRGGVKAYTADGDGGVCAKDGGGIEGMDIDGDGSCRDGDSGGCGDGSVRFSALGPNAECGANPPRPWWGHRASATPAVKGEKSQVSRCVPGAKADSIREEQQVQQSRGPYEVCCHRTAKWGRGAGAVARQAAARARGVERGLATSLADVQAVDSEGNTILCGADVERNVGAVKVAGGSGEGGGKPNREGAVKCWKRPATTSEVGKVETKRKGTVENRKTQGRSSGGGREQTRWRWSNGEDDISLLCFFLRCRRPLLGLFY